MKVLDLRGLLCCTGRSDLRYGGAVPFRHLNMIVATLYMIFLNLQAVLLLQMWGNTIIFLDVTHYSASHVLYML